jgi:hypothetical protein
MCRLARHGTAFTFIDMNYRLRTEIQFAYSSRKRQLYMECYGYDVSSVASWIMVNLRGHKLNISLPHDMWSEQQSSHTLPQNMSELTEPPEQSAGRNCHDISITAKRHSRQTFWSKSVTSHVHILVSKTTGNNLEPEYFTFQRGMLLKQELA